MGAFRASRWIPLFLAIGLVLPVSCIKVSPPGIFPPVENEAGARWRVTGEGFSPEESGNWSFEAVFIPGEDEIVLSPEDISVSLDGNPMSHTFQVEYQRLAVEFHSLPQGKHIFSASPSRSTSKWFPDLIIEFEVPER